MKSTQIPTKIWFLWYQGKNQMPEIVQMCYDSWARLNPNWEIVFLDLNNLNDFINFSSELNLEKENISIQAQSDIIRINLLKKYGGVWVDATCYCNIPLDTWLEKNLESGFFAFSQPQKNKMISSWFLAAKPKNELVNTYCSATNNFWQWYAPLKLVQNKGKHSLQDFLLLKILALKPTLWLSDFTLTKLKKTHYFWFHFLFKKLYKTDRLFKNIWDNTPKIPADLPHVLVHHGFNQPVTSELREVIHNPKSPVFKLNWRKQFNKNIPNSAISVLKELHYKK